MAMVIDATTNAAESALRILMAPPIGEWTIDNGQLTTKNGLVLANCQLSIVNCPFSSAAPYGRHRVGVVEQVAVVVGVESDDGAIEAGGGHVVEGDGDAVDIDDLIPVDRPVGVREPVAASAAAGCECNAENATFDLAMQVLGSGP